MPMFRKTFHAAHPDMILARECGLCDFLPDGGDVRR
jgi:hypothetical protein